MPSLGPTELILILVIVVIFFGVGRLPEVFGVALDLEFAGDIEDPANADQRIELNPGKVVGGILDPALQDAVHERPGVLHVAKEIPDPGAHQGRHELFVKSGGRLEHDGVDAFVELHHAAVKGLERIARVGAKRATGEQAAHHHEEDCTVAQSASAGSQRSHHHFFGGLPAELGPSAALLYRN